MADFGHSGVQCGCEDFMLFWGGRAQLPHPDMLIWLWQGARQDNITRPPATSHRPLSSAADLQSLILSLRTDDIRLAGGVRDYEALKREIGLPRDFELRSQAAKCDALRSFVCI